MIFAEFKDVIALCASEAGIKDYELYYTGSDSTEVKVFGGEVNGFTSSVSGGVSFRCIIDDHAGSAYTQELSAAQAASLVKRAKDNALTIESDDIVCLAEGGQTYSSCAADSMPLLSGAQLTDLAFAAEKALQGSHELITDRCRVTAASEAEEIRLVNSKGVDLSWNASMDVIMMQAVVEKDGESNAEFETKVADPASMDLDTLAAKAAEGAAAKLGSVVPDTANCPVVFSAGAMCSLLATFSGLFSAANARKGLSVFAGKEGTIAASPAFTLIDDPFYEGNPARISFDGEGSPAYCKEIISEGKLNTLLYDLASAAALGKKTTGNARRASYASPVTVGPFTMYVKPGTLTEDEMLSQVGNGIYISSLGGLHAGANAITGDFSLQSTGFLIENGRKTTAIRSFTVAGNFAEMLKKITAVANEVKLPNAGSITAYGSPAVWVDSLSISGK